MPRDAPHNRLRHFRTRGARRFPSRHLRLGDVMNDNPSAFPWPHVNQMGERGMTLRDWYIGQALTGLLAGRGERSLRFNPEDDAEYLGRIADALLAERAKEERK